MTPDDGPRPSGPPSGAQAPSGNLPRVGRRVHSAIPRPPDGLHGGFPHDTRRGDGDGDSRRARLAKSIVVGFTLDGVRVDPRDVDLALTRRFRRERVASSQERRIRTHAAVLLGIERSIRKLDSLRTESVLRWYTRLNGGLSVTAVPDGVVSRLGAIVDRINAPSHDRRRVLRDASALYANLLADPLFAGFNGTLSRLLIRYQLGRSALAVPVPDPPDDPAGRHDETSLAAHLLRQMEQSITSPTRQRPRPI